jgi:dihydrofolate synthase / folylpolyglutamate synthase
MPSRKPSASSAPRPRECGMRTGWPGCGRVEAELDRQCSETRIAALIDLLGLLQRGYPVLHVAGGTNGKTSVARMLDTLLTRLSLRGGPVYQPASAGGHRVDQCGRSADQPQRYADAFADIAPYVGLVDACSEVPLSNFEASNRTRLRCWRRSHSTQVAESMIAGWCPRRSATSKTRR